MSYVYRMVLLTDSFTVDDLIQKLYLSLSYWTYLVTYRQVKFSVWFSAPGDCTFDSDLCGYTQAVNDQFDWSRIDGSTPSSFTGPTADHTTGSGST